MSASGRFNKLQCISSSTMAGVGQWIAPDRNNITEDNTDLFNITVGGLDDPGFTSIELKDGASLAVEDEGVYTCIIPNENGDMQYLFVGLYRRQFNSKDWSNTRHKSYYFTIILQLCHELALYSL